MHSQKRITIYQFVPPSLKNGNLNSFRLFRLLEFWHQNFGLQFASAIPLSNSPTCCMLRAGIHQISDEVAAQVHHAQKVKTFPNHSNRSNTAGVGDFGKMNVGGQPNVEKQFHSGPGQIARGSGPKTLEDKLTDCSGQSTVLGGTLGASALRSMTKLSQQAPCSPRSKNYCTKQSRAGMVAERNCCNPMYTPLKVYAAKLSRQSLDQLSERSGPRKPLGNNDAF